MTIPHQPTRPPASSRQNRPALNDLHNILGQIAKEILQAEKRRKELEKELRSALRKSCHINNKDLIPYLSSHTNVVEHAIYEWFGENPKGKINKESFEKIAGRANINPIINRTYFKRKPDYSHLEPLKKSNPATISHEGMGLDQAAQSIISEYLQYSIDKSEHLLYSLDESEIMEGEICLFMITYPQGGRDFRRHVRNLIKQERNSDHGELIHDLKQSLKQTVSEIKENYEFAQALLKEGLHNPNIRIQVMPISAILHTIPSEKNPKVRTEMLRGLHGIISNHPAVT
jgi:hypothetical protein